MDIFSKVFKSVAGGIDKLQRDADVQKWLDELDEAQKREKNWRDKASRVVDIYEMEEAASSQGVEGSSDFNILLANTETLAPSVYNNTPRPVVKRKIQKQNPIAVAAAKVLQHTLIHLNDNPDQDAVSFDELQRSAVIEALIPGRGLCRFSYDADVDGPEGARTVTSETVCGDSVPWNRVVYGYAKQWANVPWLAYEHFMTKDECIANFGEELGAQIKLTHAPSTDSDKDGENAMPADAQGVKFAHIWEIWDKRTKTQIFISEGYPHIAKTNADPLGLEGFFNSPRPIQFLNRIKSLVPNILYLAYEKQAQELDDVTRRIGSLTRAMKIRGFYDGTLEGLDELLKKPENTLMPASNVAAMQQGMSLEKAIWLMPLEKLIAVLQQLYLNRSQIIQTIQKLSGVADIMLGQSAASETLGAQKIKESWGTLRIKKMQKEVQRFTRDCYRLQAEIAVKKFSQETFQAMTGLELPTNAMKQQGQMQLQQLQGQMEAMQAQAQQGGQQLPPQAGQQLQQQMAQIQSMLALPSWEDVISFLKSDPLRNFGIDIETNSTVDVEATEDKAQLSEFMNAMAQVLNGTLPMVKEGILPFSAAKALMLSIVRQFRLDDEVEEAVSNMQEPKPQVDPAQQKVQAEMQRDQQKFQMEQQAAQQELRDKQALAQQEMAQKQQELAIKGRELQMKERELVLKEEFMLAKHQKDMEMLAAKAAMPAPTPAGA